MAGGSAAWRWLMVGGASASMVGQSAIATPAVDSDTVAFNLTSVDVSRALWQFDCSHRAGRKVAKFRIRFDHADRGVADGTLMSLPGSDSPKLLEDLATTLGTTKPVDVPDRVSRLFFSGAIFGTKLTRTENGFSSDQPGQWTVIKAFFPMHGDDGEMFINLNPKARIGEFTAKHPRYGVYLIHELSTVL